jgi:hypothetical protein
MFNRGPKLHIRLPEDDEHGPNPYDSKTEWKHTQPRWKWDWTWWLTIIVLGLALGLSQTKRAGLW